MSAAEDTLPTTAAATDDATTAEQIRAILADEGTPEEVKEEVRNGIHNLFSHYGGGDLEETPEYFILLFDSAVVGLRHYESKGPDADKARELYVNVLRLAEQHEPADARLARRALALGFPTDEAHAEAEGGTFRTGGVVDVVWELSDELRVCITHPEVFPAVLRVVIREARKIASERVADTEEARQAWLQAHPIGQPRPWMISPDLRKLERLTKKK
jgi:hypothetical protein